MPQSKDDRCPDDAFEARPTEIGAKGDAIARIEGRTIYLSYALPGERVVARPEQERDGALHAVAWRILEPSPEREKPVCGYFGECGGCKLQHWREAPYRAWKQGLVVQALAKRGIDPPQVIEATFVAAATRRRAELAFVGGKRTGILGFHAMASEKVVDVAACPLLTSGLNGALPALRQRLERCLTEGERADVLLTEADNGIDILISAARGPDEGARSELIGMASGSAIARACWRKGDGAPEVVCQFRPPRIELGRVGVELPSPSFLQPSREGEAVLRALVLQWLGAPRHVVELFCGIGTFTFAIAAGARVLAADGSGPAVDALRKAVRAAGLERRIEVARRDLEHSPLSAQELQRFDAVVLDPPRSGAKAQSHAIAKSQVARVIYISCNPSSFARDARVLIDGGYRLKRLHALDQFRWSAHLELVGLFEKKRQRQPR
jgi:23S rRNA (uracil1939-C5)-methyltransferase